ncbi:MAG TPA: nuclear transport factor 2 family protein [Pyrinomonadaceae bacterium]|nr:nuclear transport factor 2 family protein [Pyrinomonadaceae bacterium]
MLLSVFLFLFLQPAPASSLTGVYRIDIAASDRLYSVLAGASSNVPFAEQQRFFIDLAVRLTPPDLLAIQQQGTHISLGSSRAPRMTFIADGLLHTERGADGHLIRARLTLDSTAGHERLVFTSSGNTEDNLTVTFESLDNGRRLRVVRRIGAAGLDQPLVIRTVYNKISEVARWELYGESQVAATAIPPLPGTSGRAANTSRTPPATAAQPLLAKTDQPAAGDLRDALNEWIAATNNRDIDRQMRFYLPALKRFYLRSDVSRSFVREEKARVFANARAVDIQAAEPEIIFQDGGRTAVMRYRKKYNVDNGKQSRHGEVIQELRWQRTGAGWRIFYERDIRVLR